MKIAFSGKICTGKTTACRYLTQQYGFVCLRLSDPLKQLEQTHAASKPADWESAVSDVVDELICWLQRARSRPGEEVNAEALRGLFLDETLKAFRLFEPKPNQKNRELLQYLGTEVGRRIDPDLWVDCLIGRVMHLEGVGYERIAVDDVRFPNELEGLRRFGFTMVRLRAGSRIRNERIERIYGTYDPEILAHPSELALDGREADFDYVLDTSGPVEALYKMLDGLIITGGLKLEQGAPPKASWPGSGVVLSSEQAGKIREYLQELFEEASDEYRYTFAFTKEAYDEFVVPLEKRVAELKELIGLLGLSEKEEAAVG